MKRTAKSAGAPKSAAAISPKPVVETLAQNSAKAAEIIKKEAELPAAPKELSPTAKRLKELDDERKSLLEKSRKEKADELQKRKDEKKAADEKKLKEKEAADAKAAADKAEAEKLIGDAEAAFALIEAEYLEIKSKYDSALASLKELRLKLNPKASKKGTTKKDANGEKKPGVIASIAELIEAAGPDGISKKEILENLVILFPENDPDSMMGTIKAQVPYRINKEKFLIEKDADGKWHKI